MDNFVEKYFELRNLKKEDLEKILNKRKNEFLKKYQKQNMIILLSMKYWRIKIIKEKLGKEANILAYPWGNKYRGSKKEINKLEVDTFILTGSKKNSYKLNKNGIFRINGDKLKNFDKFKKIIN